LANPSDTLPLSEGRVGERWHVPLQESFRPRRPAPLSLEVPAAAKRPRPLSLPLSLDQEREQKFFLAFRLERQFHLRRTIEEHSAVLIGHAQLHRDQRRAESGFG